MTQNDGYLEKSYRHDHTFLMWLTKKRYFEKKLKNREELRLHADTESRDRRDLEESSDLNELIDEAVNGKVKKLLSIKTNGSSMLAAF